MNRAQMMERARFAKYGSKMIFTFDFSRLPVEDAREVAQYGKTIIARMPPASILTLTDVTGVVYDEAFNAVARDLVAHNKAQVRAGAVVGVSGWRKVVFWAAQKFCGRDNLRLFDDVEEARTWLVGYGGS